MKRNFERRLIVYLLAQNVIKVLLQFRMINLREQHNESKQANLKKSIYKSYTRHHSVEFKEEHLSFYQVIFVKIGKPKKVFAVYKVNSFY